MDGLTARRDQGRRRALVELRTSMFVAALMVLHVLLLRTSDFRGDCHGAPVVSLELVTFVHSFQAL
jgi:hypothetical protein